MSTIDLSLLLGDTFLDPPSHKVRHFRRTQNKVQTSPKPNKAHEYTLHERGVSGPIHGSQTTKVEFGPKKTLGGRTSTETVRGGVIRQEEELTGLVYGSSRGYRVTYHSNDPGLPVSGVDKEKW